MPKARKPTTAGLFLLCLILSASIRGSAAQTESLDNYLKRTFTSIPGAAVSVISGGKIVFENGYGYADSEKKTLIDRNTRFELASVTKAIAEYLRR